MKCSIWNGFNSQNKFASPFAVNLMLHAPIVDDVKCQEKIISNVAKVLKRFPCRALSVKPDKPKNVINSLSIDVAWRLFWLCRQINYQTENFRIPVRLVLLNEWLYQFIIDYRSVTNTCMTAVIFAVPLDYSQLKTIIARNWMSLFLYDVSLAGPLISIAWNASKEIIINFNIERTLA